MPVASEVMHLIGGDTWTWRLASSRPVAFCVWTLVQDGLHVHPFDIHSNGNGRLRQAGMDAAGWTDWFETVVNREVDPLKPLVLRDDLEPPLSYQSDPPPIAEQLKMQQALRASSPPAPWKGSSTPPALWRGSMQVGELLEGLWDDYTSRPVLRRNRPYHLPRDREEPGTIEQSHELYGLLRRLGSNLPSLHCYGVAYPALVVRVVAPMALVLTSPRQWTWDRYRDALLTGVASLAGETRP